MRRVFFAAGLVAAMSFSVFARADGPMRPVASSASAAGVKLIETKSGLKYEDVKVGDKALAVAGKRVTVHYVGTLSDGKKFDSSHDRDEPIVFTLGAGEVIKGWDEGIAGMKVGGIRKLIVPAHLGYGNKGVGGVIPPGAELRFEVELLAVE